MNYKHHVHSYWLDSLPDPLEPRRALTSDQTFDVAIIGAGYTGLWTAYYLQKHQPDLSIAVVEAEFAGYGASGRNGGWCSGFLSGIDHWLESEEHRDRALALQRMMFDAVRETGEVAQHEGIDCHFDQSGALEVAVHPYQLKRLKEEVEHAHSLGFSDDDYRWLDQDQVKEKVNIDRAAGGLVMSHCAAIHPARLARGLAEVVERSGVTVYEKSPVVDFGEGFITTPAARIQAPVVLNASEGYGGSLPGRKRQLVPVHSMMVCTAPLNDSQLVEIGLNKRYTFANGDHRVTYGQLTKDGRIAFGCRGTYRFGAQVQRKFESTDTNFDIIQRTLLKLFPGLDGIEFTHGWGGAMGVSRSLSPSIMFSHKAGMGWAGGYFGNGVAAAHLAGRTLADLVLERNTERVATPWVNTERAKRQWETEPFRWLGIRAARSLMGVVDRAEYRGSSLAPVLNKALERLWH